MTGTFVTFEGVDSAGKSTVLAGIDAVVNGRKVSGFSNSVVGNALRELRQNEWMMRMEPVGKNAYSELYLLLSEDIYQYEQLVRPAVVTGETVLKERFLPSKLAYQSHFIEQEHGISPERTVASILDSGYLTRLLPDHVVVLTTPIEALTSRIERIDGRTVSETERETLDAVQRNYRIVVSTIRTSNTDCTVHEFDTHETSKDRVVTQINDVLAAD